MDVTLWMRRQSFSIGRILTLFVFGSNIMTACSLWILDEVYNIFVKELLFHRSKTINWSFIGDKSTFEAQNWVKYRKKYFFSSKLDIFIKKNVYLLLLSLKNNTKICKFIRIRIRLSQVINLNQRLVIFFQRYPIILTPVRPCKCRIRVPSGFRSSFPVSE